MSAADLPEGAALAPARVQLLPALSPQTQALIAAVAVADPVRRARAVQELAACLGAPCAALVVYALGVGRASVLDRAECAEDSGRSADGLQAPRAILSPSGPPPAEGA